MSAPPPFVLTRRQYLAGRRRVSVFRVPRQDPIGQHRHEFYEIAIVVSGSGVHMTGDYRHEIAAGDVLILNPRRSHGFDECRNLQIVNILIRGDTLRRIGRKLSTSADQFHRLFESENRRWRRRSFITRIFLSPVEREHLNQIVDRLDASTKGGAASLMDAYLLVALDLLCHVHARGPSPSPAPSDARIEKAFEIVRAGLGRPIPIPHLAARSGMSARNFHRAFLARLGVTPHAYIAKQRLARAVELLARPGSTQKLAVIADACGFDDSNYFARWFRKQTGRSPIQYRRAKRSHPT